MFRRGNGHLHKEFLLDLAHLPLSDNQSTNILLSLGVSSLSFPSNGLSLWFCSKPILAFSYLKTSTFESTQTDRPALAFTLNLKEVDLRSGPGLVCLSVCYLMSILSPNSAKIFIEIRTLSTDSAILIWILITTPNRGTYCTWCPGLELFSEVDPWHRNLRYLCYFQAGIASPEYPDQLLIALEPEAASIYCRRLRMHQLVPERPVVHQLTPYSPGGKRSETPEPMNMERVSDDFRSGRDDYLFESHSGTLIIVVDISTFWHRSFEWIFTPNFKFTESFATNIMAYNL